MKLGLLDLPSWLCFAPNCLVAPQDEGSGLVARDGAEAEVVAAGL